VAKVFKFHSLDERTPMGFARNHVFLPTKLASAGLGGGGGGIPVDRSKK
jgi:hypothetical protein